MADAGNASAGAHACLVRRYDRPGPMEVFSYTVRQVGQVGPDVFRLPVTPYEQHLLSRVEPRPTWDWSVLAAHRRDHAETRSREELAGKVERLIVVLERDHARLQYRYGLREEAPGRPARKTGSGGRSCSFRGERAIAEAGPGFARIYAADFHREGGVTRVEERVLCDLRDLRPVPLDDGTVVTAYGRKRPVDLLARFRALGGFLAAHDVPTIGCAVSVVAGPASPAIPDSIAGSEDG